MDIEVYIKGVVAQEMPALFSMEALKAQAVAARTYTRRRMRDYGGSGCNKNPQADVCTESSHCQAWISEEDLKKRWGSSFSRYNKLIVTSVEETKSLIMKHKGQVIDAVYSSTCGGKTASAAEVWGNHFDYLRSVHCDTESHSPHHYRKKDIKLEDLAAKVKVNLEGTEVSINGKTLIDITKTETGRAKEIKLGGKSFTGKEFRALLNLPSNYIETKVGTIPIITRGFGHGVGMCQYGADGMGKEGRTYQDILKHYYQGITLDTLDEESVPENPAKLEDIKIVLDPGHGGRYPGAVGPTGLTEKEVNLNIAQRTARLCEQEGAGVMLTRTEDKTTSLNQRVTIANNFSADIFVSIHSNGFSDSRANGIETYHYPSSSLGRTLAISIQKSKINKLGLRDRGVKTAYFYVLRETKMPAVLSEIGFITNPVEEKLLKQDSFRQIAAESLLEGIINYFNK